MCGAYRFVANSVIGKPEAVNVKFTIGGEHCLKNKFN